MNTKRKISTALLLVFCILSSAEPITVNKARQTAVNFFSQHGKTLSSSTQPAKAPRRSTTAKDSAYYYVFNADSGSGYVIISGDDRTQQVLGYSDDGKFDEKNMSDDMKSWLQSYADEIKYIQDNNLKVTSSAKKISAIANSSTRHSVTPLMTCKWDQRAPYNQSCPMYTASDGNQYQSVTGCVATALAQVMYYYKYPKQIKTDLPYSWFDWSEFKTITFDKVPAGTAIDWDNMLDVTTSSNAAENRNAVSKLMLYVGQAIKTTYGAASSAYVNGTTVDALKTYFGYDDGTYSVSRSSYSENNWIDLIYKDIAAGHPVPMAGSSTGGRHCFVLDGFDGDEYFHLNWGWGGTNNGYYLVSALNPYDNSGAGAGTSTDGYSMDEVAFIGMQPANGIASDNEGTQMDVSNISVSGSKVSCNYTNRTDYDLTFNMGIAYVANDGTLVTIGSPNTAKVNSGSSTTKSFTVSELAAGTYRIVPISKVSTGNDWRTMLDINNEYIKAVVSTSGSVTLTYIKNSSALSVSNIEIVGNKTKGYKQEVQVTLNNKGSEYYGYIYLIVASDSLSKDISTYTQLSVGNDRSVTKSLTFTPSTSGKYTIYIATSNSTSSPLAKQAVNISTDGATTLSLTGTTIDNALSGTAYGNFIKGKMALKNTGTNDFNGKIQVVLWENKTGSGTFYSSTKLTKDISVAAGETTYTDFLFDDLEVGQKYAFGVAYTDRSGYINKIGSTYSLSSGLLEYKKDGSINICRTIFNITTHDDVVALDLRSDSKIRTLKPNNNPNTLYFLPEGATAPETLNGRNVIYGTKTDSININIDSAFFNPIKFTVSKIKISKTFSNPQKRWVSIIFPFIPSVVTINGKTITWFQNKTSSTKGIKMKEFKYLSINDEVGLDDVETLQTSTPYIMSSIDKGGNNLYGNTVTFSASNTEIGITNQSDIIVGSDAFNYYGSTVGIAQDNAYVLNNEGTAFIPKTNVSIEPFGSYFTCKLVASKRPTKIIVEDVVTDINNIGISAGNAKLQVYSLNGMKVAEAYVSNGHITLPALPKGIYIVGGKKIAVK